MFFFLLPDTILLCEDSTKFVIFFFVKTNCTIKKSHRQTVCVVLISCVTGFTYLSIPHASAVISEHLQNNKASVFSKTSFTTPAAVGRFKFIVLAQFLKPLRDGMYAE